MYNQTSKDIFDYQILSDNVKKIGKQDVHLWGIHRNLYDEQKNYSEYLLNEDEQNRAQRFRFREHHDMFVIGRYITKILLAYYTESTPESVKIIPGPYGKPTCEVDLCFNLSHSDDQLLLGFSNSEIGVDIERNDPTVDIEGIGECYFSGIELQKMMHCPKDERAKTFFEIWTKKESLIKGIGKGLNIPLQDFNVTNRNGKVFWELPTENNYQNWYAQNIETKQGFTSALATQYKVGDLSYFCHDNWCKQ